MVTALGIFVQMNIYNNELIGVLSLQEVLFITKKCTIVNLAIVLPIIFHKKSLNYLAHKKTKIISIQDLLLTKPELLSSLNKRYYNFLPITINCLSLCIENNIASLENGEFSFSKRLIDDMLLTQLGNRVIKIKAASENIASIISDSPSNVYDLCGISL
ncbi:three component ABC system middle component [Serratia fonticola]|uniref:three component ABC system middle component n=1 Tax=Serratia fonticola TaxID=47917 RepID=UPI0027BA6329|nr:three component ABC system middle component [Serratia fonticola]